jgi:fibrillarin-like rRNA methylase
MNQNSIIKNFDIFKYYIFNLLLIIKFMIILTLEESKKIFNENKKHELLLDAKEHLNLTYERKYILMILTMEN